MALRSELMPPKLDEKLVLKLTSLSEEIDCGERDLTEHMVLEFNQLASTSFDFLDFQGIYGGQDHDTWVRKVLYEPYIKPVPDVTTDELVEMMRRVMECDGAEHEVDFWLFMLEAVCVKVVVVSCLTDLLLGVSLTIQIHMVRQLPAADSSSPALWIPTLSHRVDLFTLLQRSSILP
ncbi:hypothetical protein, partial [Pseudomonas sp. DE0157]|uniref:hypothetical protein n=1 Tax=Pseudomonas sp. DE0157 TaxID=2584952 RepID=UPI0011A2B588